MTKLKRTLLLIASSCLIMLLTASFAMAEDVKLPSDEAIFNAFIKIYKGYKGGSMAGKFKDDNGSYLLFFKNKKGNPGMTTARLFKLDSGIWTVYVSDGKETYGGTAFIE